MQANARRRARVGGAFTRGNNVSEFVPDMRDPEERHFQRMPQSRLSISVAMCTYNGAKYLFEQLQSIGAQTRSPDEVVVCDDGSTDLTAQIIGDFARSVPFPVRIFRNPQNLGSTKNFEKAIGLCTGDLIALSDQDDIWMPDRLDRQAEMFEQDTALGGVFTDAEIVDDKSRSVGKRLWTSIFFTPAEQRIFAKDQGFSILLRKYVVTGATLMVRASLREQYLPISEVWGHEAWMALILAIHSHLRIIDEPLIRYRIHAGQQVGLKEIDQPLPPTMWERLQRGKNVEREIHAARARELKELERLLANTDDPKSEIVLPDLRLAIRFFEDRGGPYPSRIVNFARILRNAANYPRFEPKNAWKCLVRDLVIACL